ncbi:MAG: RdgB/HAM1 family non-canonical purine NTP pyrophosphatase [Actinomycetes bacterium]
MIPRLVIATKNQGKVAEMRDLLQAAGIAAEVVEGLEWDDVEETGETLEENALLKARAVCEATGLPALADDTGLEVEALGGRPGVRTGRFAGPDATYDENVDHLLSLLGDRSDRTARFRTALALVFPDGTEVTAEGVVEGEITFERRGTGGFGYDPVFAVDGVTLAEMGMEAKNRISHRARAVAALAEVLGAG